MENGYRLLLKLQISKYQKYSNICMLHDILMVWEVEGSDDVKTHDFKMYGPGSGLAKHYAYYKNVRPARAITPFNQNYQTQMHADYKDFKQLCRGQIFHNTIRI